MPMTAILMAALCALTAGTAQQPRVLADFGTGFDASARIEQRGAAGQIVQRDAGSALRIEFASGQGWPGLFVRAEGGAWDLSEFDRVEADVRNTGGAKVRLFMRVDNPGADGRQHCNTESVTLDPGQQSTITVVFGRSWGGAGYPVNPGNVTGVLFFVDHPAEDCAVVVDRIRAGGALADLPDWLGTRPPVPGQWEMTLNEEFNGAALNTDLWNTRLVWDGPAESELQAYSPKNISVQDGAVRLRFEKRTAHQYDDPNLPTRPYATACLTTFDKFTQRYGYFEARVRFPTARGGWPAFWMMPDRGPGRGDVWQRRSTHDGGMEIDIAEHLCEWGPGLYNCAAHWDGYAASHRNTQLPLQQYARTADGFHTFGLLWEPARLVWFCDGKEKVRWENERVGSVPAFLKFTIQVGGAWATHDVDDGALPDQMLVDYARVWQRADLAELNRAEQQIELQPAARGDSVPPRP